MKTNCWQLIIVFLFLGLKWPLFADETNGVLQGEVFIVTKAAENVRLGLVEVVLFSENDITNYVAYRNSRIEVERPDFDKQIADSEKAISELKADFENNKEKLTELSKAANDTAAAQAFAELNKKSIAVIEQIKASEEKAKENWPASSHYFKDLPVPLTSARTDADGRFSLAMPKQGRFAIAAHASRELPNSKEEYYWLVWESLNGKETEKIILGNQNTMSSGSRESVVSTKSD